ncbi:MAG: four helix bundle protein [Dysgonamonadaceae bacterium]|jgi:four helix bundle protein|nr:four helix bundle protein [Dysgonamonadaceae bacterium]
MKKRDSILREKSYKFAIRMVRLSRFLQQEKKEFVLRKQILRNGTAIGAWVRETEYAQSDADFINKVSVSSKEANKTDYWLSLLKDTDYIDVKLYESLFHDYDERISMLVSTIKTMKSKKRLTLSA